VIFLPRTAAFFPRPFPVSPSPSPMSPRPARPTVPTRRAFLGTALAFSVWCLDVYLIDLGPHWSQREILFAVYDVREHDEPIVGWQLNWKGENFYTGNRCAMLDCGDLPFCSNHARQWMENHRGQRVFFVTERSHGSSIMSHVRATGGTARELTDAWDQNKFVLIEATVGAGTGTR